MNNPWQMVNKHIEPTGYIHESVADKLKRTQEELGRHGRLTRARNIKAGVLGFLFGMALGAFGMVYFEQPKPQPVVASPTAVTVDQLADIERRMAALEAAKEANTVRAEQRVMDMRTALDKLEKLKAKQDGQFAKLAPVDVVMPPAWDGGSISVDTTIKQKATELGVTRMVVK